ncbi:MAG: hypothetical protein JO308_05660 [Verrucomicrobia bacterium]|nr:hypothetical protein [Verrucomicrobiota bacterium]
MHLLPTPLVWFKFRPLSLTTGFAAIFDAKVGDIGGHPHAQDVHSQQIAPKD